MNSRNVGIFIYDDVEVLDFTGPYEVFNVANRVARKKLFNVHLVAEKDELVHALNNFKVLPHYSIQNCPEPDILVIPGGQGRKIQMQNAALLDWIKKCFQKTELLLSVCTGSFIIGKTELLDNLSATTHYAAYDEFEFTFPKINLKRNVRFTVEEKINTSGGISAGIDVCLQVISNLIDKELAIATAKRMEYVSFEPAH